MKKWRLLLLLSAGSCLWACGGAASRDSRPPIAPQEVADYVMPPDAQGIRTALVGQSEIPDYLEVAGRVQADPTRVVRVFPPVGGRLLAVKVRPSDRVKKGQLLALLDSSEVSAARADYWKAEADAELKQKALWRASLLFENQVLPEKDYQQATADAEMAKAELERAQARLRLLGVSPKDPSGQLTVSAPRAGVVLDIGGAPGELSRALDAPTPLCTLADLSAVWVVGDVYEKDLAGLKVGKPVFVAVSAYPGKEWRGKVAAISDAVDPLTRTSKLRVVLANPQQELKPEMFATIRVLRSSLSGILIPSAAILREGAEAYVFVQKAPGHFERRKVIAGRMVGAQAEVTSGLRDGETIVTEGAPLLRAGAS